MTEEEARKMRGYTAGYVYRQTNKTKEVPEIYVHLSTNLQKVMEIRNVNAYDLAAKTGTSYETIMSFIDCKRKMTIVQLANVADALNVSVDRLLKRGTK